MVSQMQVTELVWSKTEEALAREAFELAQKREINALIREVNQAAGSLSELNDLWQLHDFLSARRHAIDGKYYYDPASLIFLFAQLMKEGWLHFDDLAGLEKDKLARISSLSRIL
jgi:hypothetical protein